MIKRFLALFAVTCGLAASGSTAKADSTLKIVFPTTPHTFALPHFIAQDLGWLKDAGLTIDEQWLIGDTTVVRMCLTGDVDTAVTGNIATFTSIAAGASIQAYAAQQSVADFQLVADKSIQNFADFAGKRFAAGPPQSIQTELARILLQKHGVDVGAVEFMQSGGTPDRLKALVAGQAQGTLLATAFALQSLKYPQLHIMVSIPQEFPGMGYSYLVATKKALADPEKRKMLETYTQLAVVRASRYIVDHPDEALKVLLKRVPSLDADTGREAITALNRDHVWGINGGIEPETTDFSVKFSRDTGSLDKPLTYADIVDPSLVNEALAKEGKR